MQALAQLIQCTGPVISLQGQPIERLCTLCDLITLGDTVKNILVGLLAALVALMIVYGGFTMMLSGGDPGKFKRGKDIIVSALIGLAIVLSAWILVGTLFRVFNPKGGLAPWNEIRCQQ